MHFIPFSSFFIWNYRDTWAIQSSVIIAILLAALVVAAIKKELKIPLIALPYIALPILLFATVNGKLEFASDDRLLCLSMLACTILIFSQKELYSKWLFRCMLICGNLHLIIQAYALIAGNGAAIQSLVTRISIEKISRSGLFPLANEIMFFYMLVSFSAVFAFCKEKDFWKKYAAVIGSLAFFSIILGDPATIGKISGEDAVGIWLGLACGALFSFALFLWRKYNLPKMLALSISDLILLAMIFTPVLVIHFHIFSKDAMGEVVSRLVNWQAAWDLVKENPFGVGFGAYGANIMQHWPTLEDAYFATAAVYIAAHNQYLQILTEIGWLGLLYYSALFAFPWFIAIFNYLKTGELRFLFIAGVLTTVLSVMEVSEAMSMFAFIQIIHWGLLIYCVKAVLPILPPPCQKCLNLHFLWVLPLVPLIAYLLFDRGKQLHSAMIIDPLVGVPFINEQNRKITDDALEAHIKNRQALWISAYMHFYVNEDVEALKQLKTLEEISGYLMPINPLRTEIYFKWGNKEKACEYGNFIFPRFADGWILTLKERLNNCK